MMSIMASGSVSAAAASTGRGGWAGRRPMQHDALHSSGPPGSRSPMPPLVRLSLHLHLYRLSSEWRAARQRPCLAQRAAPLQRACQCPNGPRCCGLPWRAPVPCMSRLARLQLAPVDVRRFRGPAAGLAYLGSFGYVVDTPAFVFPQQLGGGTSAKYIWETVNHEVGHTRECTSLLLQKAGQHGCCGCTGRGRGAGPPPTRLLPPRPAPRRQGSNQRGRWQAPMHRSCCLAQLPALAACPPRLTLLLLPLPKPCLPAVALHHDGLSDTTTDTIAAYYEGDGCRALGLFTGAVPGAHSAACVLVTVGFKKTS
jgi:hypothetical protein